MIRILILFLSGITTALPLIMPRLSFLSWFSVIPLIYAAYEYRFVYFYGLIWGIGYFGVLYYWFVYLYPMDYAGLNGAESIAAIITAWLGMALMQGIEIAFVPYLFKKINKDRKNILSAVLFAAMWVLLEWFQTQTWTGVPWGRIAVSQYTARAVIQIASAAGSLAVSFLIIFINCLLTLALLKYKDGGEVKKARDHALFALVVFMFNLSFGFINLSLYKETGVPVKTALIQGNIASAEKWAENAVEYSIEKYLSLSEKTAVYDPDIILWPETVIPVSPDSVKYKEYFEDIKAFAYNRGIVLLIGSYDISYNQIKEGYDIYNAIFTINPDGSFNEAPYYKRHLVPFGEYLPMPQVIKTFLPAVSGLNVFENDITPGTSPAVSSTKFGNIGFLICFDSIYETLTVDTVRAGAELIALSTNDSWYKDSAAVYQHNGHAVLRAVESGKYIIRAANTGISSIIRADGKIMNYLAPLTEGIVCGEVYMRSGMTIYALTGNIIVWVSGIFTLSIITVNIFAKRKKNG